MRQYSRRGQSKLQVVGTFSRQTKAAKDGENGRYTKFLLGRRKSKFSRLARATSIRRRQEPWLERHMMPERADTMPRREPLRDGPAPFRQFSVGERHDEFGRLLDSPFSWFLNEKLHLVQDLLTHGTLLLKRHGRLSRSTGRGRKATT